MTLDEELTLRWRALAVRKAGLLPAEPSADEAEFLAASKAMEEASAAYSAARKRRDEALEALRPMIESLYRQLKAAA